MMKPVRRNVAALGLAALATACGPAPARPQATIGAGTRTFVVEVASSSSELRRGLMGRTSLDAGSGMLFVMPQSAAHCFWMKDTPIALSIAFIGDDGQVLNLADMEPMSERRHCAAGPARYALEVNRGLLSAAGVRAGTTIGGLPRG